MGLRKQPQSYADVVQGKTLSARIKDYRALYGAIALALIGAVLSLQSMLYLNIDSYGVEAIRARWHWELVLNIQILCFAFIWFSHHNRISYSQGRWKARAIINFLIGFAAVGMPIFLTVLGTYMNWYRNPPEIETAKYMIRVAVYIWLASNFAVPLVQSLIVKKKRARKAIGMRFGLVRHTPAFLVILFLLMNDRLPNNCGYAVAPFLCFAHGALVYLEKAFRNPPYDREVTA